LKLGKETNLFNFFFKTRVKISERELLF